MSKKIKIYSVLTQEHEPSKIVVDDNEGMAEFFADWMRKNNEIGDKIFIEIIEISEEQLLSLPDVDD